MTEMVMGRISSVSIDASSIGRGAVSAGDNPARPSSSGGRPSQRSHLPQIPDGPSPCDPLLCRYRTVDSPAPPVILSSRCVEASSRSRSTLPNMLHGPDERWIQCGVLAR
jgi:hypothetical protein